MGSEPHPLARAAERLHFAHCGPGLARGSSSELTRSLIGSDEPRLDSTREVQRPLVAEG